MNVRWIGIVQALLLTASVGLIGSAATAHADRKDPSREPGNVSVMGVDKLSSPTHREHFGMIQYTPDPIEGFNRGSLAVTKPAIHWGMRPLAKGWRFITPTFVRRSLDDLFYNLAFPSRFLSLLLQGELVKSSVETGNFLVNTTVGLGGLWDPAQHIGIPTYRQDMGLAFARWGAGPGFYFFIPVMGPSSGRDGLGRLFDMALHPLTYVPGSGLFFNMNAFTFRIDGYEALVGSFDDVYYPIRALWAIQREIAVERFSIPEEAYAASDPEPSLGVLLLKAQDPGFPGRARERNIEMPRTHRELPYSLWLQDEPAPLVFIIPGIGAHRGSTNPVAIAEMAVARGYSAVTVSSPFHEEFLLNGLSVPYPGFTPSDAEDLYTALSKIAEDLEDQYPGRMTSARLMGSSLGAIQTLFIAAAQKNRPRDALRFDRFVAINPPVNMRYAASQFDGYFDAPLRWPEEERDQKVKELAMKAFLIVEEGLDEGKPLPFDRTESEFLVGLSGRTTMLETLAAIEMKGGGVLEMREEPDRGPLLDQINQSSLRRYAEELIIPYYLSQPGQHLDPDGLAEAAGLHALERTLRRDERIHIVTNANDFLLGQEDLAWLRETVGERLIVFPDGGHLGNMHVAAVQEAVFAGLESTGE